MSKSPSWSRTTVCDEPSLSCRIPFQQRQVGCTPDADPQLPVTFSFRLRHRLPVRLPALMESPLPSGAAGILSARCILSDQSWSLGWWTQNWKALCVLGSCGNLGPGRWAPSSIPRNSNKGVLFKSLVFFWFLTLLATRAFVLDREIYACPCPDCTTMKQHQHTPVSFAVPQFTHVL